MTKELTIGDVRDFTNFMAAVIDQSAFDRNKSYIDYAKDSSEAEIIVGGTYDDSVGYFIDPTIVVTTNPKFKLMEEEIFGPVLTIYVYEDNQLDETLRLCDTTSPYGLTGAIFARDREVIVQMSDALREAAGNFYVNDKPTGGAVVGQQPLAVLAPREQTIRRAVCSTCRDGFLSGRSKKTCSHPPTTATRIWRRNNTPS